MKSVTITLAVAAALTISSLSAQAQTITTISPDVPQTEVKISQWRGQYGDTKAHNEVVTANQNWLKLWKRVSVKSPADLDEKTQTAVWISIGECPITGYKPYIISAIPRDGKMVITYSKGQPTSSDYVAQEVTHPWVSAIISNKDHLPIEFKEL